MSTPGNPVAEARVVRLFPTFAWQCDIAPDCYRRINRAILARIDELLPARDPAGGRGSGSTSHGPYRTAEPAELVGLFRMATEGAMEYLEIDPGTGLEITGCWANVNARGSSHPPHVHPNNYLSGVYSARVPAAADGLVCYDPRPPRRVIAPRAIELTPPPTGNVTLEIREGRLFVFPSRLLRSVAATRGEGERVSVSFNALFSAFTAEHACPKCD